MDPREKDELPDSCNRNVPPSHNITEIFLNVVLKTINQPKPNQLIIL
jgi:hypothetical protein